MRHYYKNKNNDSTLNLKLELTLENYSDWTQEQIDEYEEITEEEYNRIQAKLFPEPTEEELEQLRLQQEKQNRIAELKQLLNDSDYLVVKHMEGLIPEDKWEEIKVRRQSYRDEINQLEEELNGK
jgi:hypothetical protein